MSIINIQYQLSVASAVCPIVEPEINIMCCYYKYIHLSSPLFNNPQRNWVSLRPCNPTNFVYWKAHLKCRQNSKKVKRKKKEKKSYATNCEVCAKRSILISNITRSCPGCKLHIGPDNVTRASLRRGRNDTLFPIQHCSAHKTSILFLPTVTRCPAFTV